MPDLVRVERIAGDGVSILVVDGEIDLSNADEFEQELRAVAGAPRLIVDLTLCTYIDSSGLNALVRATHRPGDEGAFAVVAGPETRRILEIAGLEEVFTVYPSRDEALLAESGEEAV
jgi:anti-anti-sigma factor